MKRRAYLTTAAAVTFAGCSALTGSETDEENGGDENGNGDAGNGDAGNGDADDGPSDPIDEEAGSFDDFEDLSVWTAVHGSLSADEDRVYEGTQSARMDVEDDNEQLMIEREFDSPRDFSDEFPAFAFASDYDVTPIVHLTDTSGDWLQVQCSVRADGPFALHDLGFKETGGDPDLSSIESTKVSVWTGGRDLSLWVDDYRFVDRPETGTVLLQFPDERAALDAAPILEEYDLPATTFVTTDYVGTEGHPTVDDLESLADAGWTVASEGATSTDYSQLDAETQEDHISSAASWLEDHGFDGAYFSYPHNRYDETTVELVDEYHDLGFVAGYAGHGHVTNPSIAPRTTDPDVEDADRLLEWTAEARTITTLSFRDPEDLEEVLETLSAYESAGDLEVVTPSDLASEYLD